ncbi:hypothetical protein MM_0655 [Methanosarcina mazei Go1]|uniref:Uncharacterized protein n=1 Tax=Methanosarcina mazei (strain ATCC BAA-159 / DSM 3647 / Goe1 / Go1 / JCM 11833 / OCM 88) TaxID=192952 RepID=Q8PZ39_METMA|nr:hypothetical protein MM_0655 [Methanosarcina mazei Go1]
MNNHTKYSYFHFVVCLFKEIYLLRAYFDFVLKLTVHELTNELNLAMSRICCNFKLIFRRLYAKPIYRSRIFDSKTS